MISITMDPKDPNKVILSSMVTLYLERLALTALSEEIEKMIRAQAIKDLESNKEVQLIVAEMATRKLIEILSVPSPVVPAMPSTDPAEKTVKISEVAEIVSKAVAQILPANKPSTPGKLLIVAPAASVGDPQRITEDIPAGFKGIQPIVSAPPVLETVPVIPVEMGTIPLTKDAVPARIYDGGGLGTTQLTNW